MAPFSWSRWLRSLSRPRTKSYRRPRRRPLALEILETRVAPATYIWTGLGASNNWTDKNNWVSSGVPAVPATNGTADLVFPSGPTHTLTNNNFPVLNNQPATFDSITFSGPNYTVTGNQIALGSPTVSGSGSLIVNAGIKNTNLNLAGGIVLAGPGTGRQFINVGIAGLLTINSQLSGTTGVDLTKEGGGTVILTKDNSGFTGPITLDTNAGIVQVTNAKALGDTSNATTVQQNAQLQVNNVSGPILENLILNGPGPLGDGALLNVAGNNTWAGNIELDSNTTFGASAGKLTVTGVISDLGSGHNVTKEGPGTVAFASADTYRGSTTINNGALEIQNALSLGTGDNTAATGVLVNQSIGKAGTLQLNDPAGVGFTVANKLLTLNGFGIYGTGLLTSTNGIGALYNLNGSNVWTGSVFLGSPAPNNESPAIGVQEATTLTVTGVVSSPNGANTLVVNPDPIINGVNLYAPNQPDAGTLIFTSANTYGAATVFLPPSYPPPQAGGAVYQGAGTVINDGILEIEDSQALGSGDVYVRNGASLALAVDANPDSITGTTNTMVVANHAFICGLGASALGALVNISGINTYTGAVDLTDLEGSTAVASIGVLPDPNPTNNAAYFPTYANGQAVSGDYSLTISGAISGDYDYSLQSGFSLDKFGGGQLILPNANNGLSSPWDIIEGWVTARNNHSLGRTIAGLDQNLQPSATVEAGAAIHLYPLAGNLDIGENLVLKGLGISHPYGLINQQGALENLAGINQEHGNIQLQRAAGIGVENVFPPAASQLNIGLTTTSPTASGGQISDAPPVMNVVSRSSGGSAESDNVIDTGATSGHITLTYDMYAAPGDSITVYYGIKGQGGVPIKSSNGPVSGSATWTFTYGPGPFTTIDIVVNGGGAPTPKTQWFYTATITPDLLADGGITKLGSQLLSIQDEGTYVGPVDIRQGVLLDQNNTGLGAGTGPDSTTTVEAGAALALANGIGVLNGGAQTGINIYGEHLVLNGPGNNTLSTGPLASLNVFADNTVPGATDPIIPSDDMWRGPVTLNSSASVAVQPNSRLILSGSIDDGTNPLPAGSDLSKVAGGELVLTGGNTYRGNTYVGAGLTAGPASDPGVPSVQAVEVSGTAAPGDTFTLKFGSSKTGNIPFGASASVVQSALNGLSSIGGVGGSVTVTKTGSFYYVIFGGTLTGVDVAALQITTTGVTLGSVAILSHGGKLSSYFGSPGAEPGGVVTVANNTGLGASSGAVFVQNGSVLQLEGNITVAGKPLTVSGSGLSTNPNPLPQTWFAQGPGPVTNGPTLGKPAPVSGRITGVATDPTDPNTIYVSTAGGGAWKTSNGGKSWTPLFDLGNNSVDFGGAIAVDPTNPLVIYYGTGEADNTTDSYYGTGVYKSTDGGRTWKLLTGYTTFGRGIPVYDGNTPPNVINVIRTPPTFHNANPFYGYAISAITIDTSQPDIIFVSTSDQAANVPTGSPSFIAGQAYGAIPPSGVGAGIWRYDPDPIRGNPMVPNGYVSDWFNMTAVTSDERYAFIPLPNSGFPTGPGGQILPPNTPGPDDLWYITDNQGNIIWTVNFPSRDAVYSDVQITDMSSVGGNVNGSGGVLYMSLGVPFEVKQNGQIWVEALNNAVYRCDDPDNPRSREFFCPPWYIGDANHYGNPPHNTYDKAGGQEYPTNLNATNGPDFRNGNIKLSAVFLQTNGPALPPFSITDVLLDTEVYAANVDISGLNLNSAMGLLDIQQTLNGGQTWAAITPPGGIPGAGGTTNFVGNQGYYDLFVLQAPDITLGVPTTLYVGGEWGMLDTANQGGNWNPISVDSRGNGPHQNFHSLAFVFDPRVVDPTTGLPSPVAVLAGTDGGIWSYNVTTGTSSSNLWTDLNTNLDISLLNSVAIVPNNPNFVVVGSQASGIDAYTGSQGWTVLSTGTQTTQQVTSVASTFGGQVAIDPNNPNTIDAWVNTSEIEQQATSSVNFIQPGNIPFWAEPSIADADPTIANMPIATLIVSYDGGKTWQNSTLATNEPTTTYWLLGSLSNYQEPAALPNGSLAYLQSPPLILDNIDTGRLLVGADYPPAVADWLNSATAGPGLGDYFGNFLAQSLAGAQPGVWSYLDGNIPFPPFAQNYSINIIAVSSYQGTFNPDPGFPQVFDVGINSYDPNTIYASDGVNLYVTKDLGTSWLNRTPGMTNFSDIIVDPRNRDTAYVASNAPPSTGSVRIMLTLDGGQTWANIDGAGSTALPDVPVNKLVLDARTGFLYAGTDTGVYLCTNPGTGNTWQRLGSGLPSVRVTDMVLDQALNTLTISTYGRGQFTMYVDMTQANDGGMGDVGGGGVWTGPVILAGSTSIGAGTTQGLPAQVLQNGSNFPQLNIVGTISDLTPGSNPYVTKIGVGNVTFSGANTYGGTTEVQQGALIVNNPQALGSTGVPEVQLLTLSQPATQLTLTFSGAPTTINLTGGPGDAKLIQDALNLLPTVTSRGGVVKVVSTSPGVFTITFGGYMTGYQQPVLQASVSSGNPPTVQELTVGAGGTIVDLGQVLELQSDLKGEPVEVSGDGILFNDHNTGALRNTSNFNTFTGALILLTNTTIGVDSGSQLTIAAPGAIVDNNKPFSPSNARTLTKELTGTLVLATANSYGKGTPGNGSPAASSTIVKAGALNVENAGALGLPNNLTTVLDGAQLQVQGGITVMNESLRLSGTGINNTGALEGTGGGANDWAGPITLAKDPAWALSPPSPPATLTTPSASVAIGALLTNPNDTLTIEGSIGQIAGSTMGITKVDAGTVVLNAVNSYTGNTTVAAGALRIENPQALGPTGSGAPGPSSAGIAATNNNSKGYTALGAGQSGGFTPPDTDGAAGPSSYIETVNQEVAIYSSKSVAAPALTDSLPHFMFTVGGLTRVNGFSIQSDCSVVYDEEIGRFVVTNLDVDPFSAHVSKMDLAVSKSSNPTSLTAADWNFYSVTTTESTFDADYPGNLGYNADALVFTLNMFSIFGGTGHVQIVSVSSSDLRNGVPQAQLHVFQTDHTGFSYRPTTMHDAVPGDPMWFVAENGNNQSLDVVKMTNVLSSTPTFKPFNLTVNSYLGAVPPLNPDGSPVVASGFIDSRILKAAEANNTIVAAQTAAVSATQDVVRWYELDVSSGSPALKDQGQIGSGNNTYLYYPGIDINAAGAIGVTFMKSGTDANNDFVSMYVTGRLPTDAAGTMATPLLVPAGAGQATLNNGRAGDLSGINVDPIDNSFWAANEYATAGGGLNWGTAVANFSLSATTGAVSGVTVLNGAALELDGDPNGTGASITVPGKPVTLNGPGTPDVQTVTINGTTGSFTLTFNKQTTIALGPTAGAGAVQSALNNLSSIKNVGGSVSVALETTAAGNVYTILFGGSLAGTDQSQITASANGGLTAVVSTARHGATGSLRNYVGNNTWASPVILNTSSSIGAEPATTLNISGIVQDVAPASVPAPILTKVSAGTVDLTGANSYTGLTQVSQGILNVQNPAALGGLVSEQQQVTLSGSLTGQFNLTFFYNGSSGTTPWLSANTTDPNFVANVTAALDTLVQSLAGPGASVNVVLNKSIFVVTFGGTLANLNLNQMSGQARLGAGIGIITLRDGSAGTTVTPGGTLQEQGGISVATEPLTLSGSGTSAVQDFTAAGAFTLTFNGWTASLNAGASADDVAAALDALPSIGGIGGSVYVTFTDGIYAVTFGGTLANMPVPTMTGTGIGPNVNINVGTGSPQTITLTGAPGGGFVLSFDGFSTIPLPFGATATQVQNALFALPSIGVNNVTVTQTATNSYQVNFVGALTGNTDPLSGAPVVFTATAGGLGALDDPTGANTWHSPITLAGSASIGADTDNTGAVPTNATLILDRTIGESTPGSTLTKVGTGTVVLAGGTGNTFTGLTTVADGTLQLDKASGVLAIGNVAVGDNNPSPPNILSDVLQFLLPNQMPSNAAVAVNSDGLVDLNGQQQAIGSLTMAGGAVSITGATAVLTLNGNVTASTDAFGIPAAIEDIGQLSLNGQTRTFTVNGPNPNSIFDMIISAPIVGTGSEGITKLGKGTLDLAADNGFTGVTTISQGTILADGDATAGQTLQAVSLDGGTLGGNGAVGTVTSTSNGGVLMGGDPSPIPPGILNMNTTAANPTAVLNSATQFFMQLVPGVGNSSLLNLTGKGGAALNLNGATLGALIDPSVQIGDQFTIIQSTNGTITGRFAEPYGEESNGEGIAFINGLKFDVDYSNPNVVVLTRALENATVGLTSSVNPSAFGQDVSFTATVTAEAGAGTVPNDDTVTFTLLQGTTTITQQTINLNNQQAVFDLASAGVLPLVPGTYTVEATFNADAHDSDFAPADATPVTQTVNLANSTITLSNSPVTPIPFQQVTVTATVSAVAPGAGIPNGDVYFTLDGNLVNGGQHYPLTNGMATVVLPGPLMTTSIHLVRAYFTDSDGDFNNFSMPSDYTINVVKGNPTFSVTSSPVSSSVFGQAVTFTAALTGVPGIPPTGTVTFYDVPNGGVPNNLGTVQLVQGAASALPTSSLQPGTYTITVTYGGDVSYNGGQGSLTGFQVNPANTSTSLSNAVNPAAFGQTITITASVSAVAPGAGTPLGTVIFYDNGTKIGSGVLTQNGTAVLITNSLGIGTHPLTASYQGNADFNGSNSSSFPQTIMVGTSVTVTTAIPTSVFGQQVTFTATLKSVLPPNLLPPPGEKVTFTDTINKITTTLGTGTLNSSGVAILPYSGLSVGTHTITASYGGDSNFIGSSGTVTQVVNRDATTTTVKSLLTPSAYGQTVNFSVTVTANKPGAGTPTGTVNLYNGSVATANFLGSGTLFGGTVTIPIASSKLTASATAHTVVAAYADDTNFAPSQASTSQLVNKATTTSTIAGSDSSSVYGQWVTFTVTVTPQYPGVSDPTGSVTFYDGPVGTGTNLGARTLTASGNVSVAKLLINTLSVTSHNITAAYGGDSNFGTSNTNAGGPASLTVSKDTTTTGATSSLPDPVGSAVGQSVTFTATVTADAPGVLVPDGSVTFVDSSTSKTLGTVTLSSSGKATLATSGLAFGVHTITFNYSGSARYILSSTSITQTVRYGDTVTVASSNASPNYGDPLTFTATVAPSGSVPAGTVPNGTVDFFDGTTDISGPIALGTVGNNGVATFSPTTPLNPGTHSITVKYSGDPNFITNASKPFSQIVKGFTSMPPLISSSNPSFFDQTITLTATVAPVSPATGVPTGVVTFFDQTTNTTLGTANLTNGTATLTYSKLAVGSHNIIASYGGSSLFVGSTSPTLTQVINAQALNTLVGSLPNNPSGAPVNSQFVLRVTAIDALGNQDFADFDAVALVLISGPTGGTLTGYPSLTGQFNNGVMNFTVSVNLAGTYTVQMMSHGLRVNFTFSTSGRQT
jgi:autotransporter-associated beta strand protein